jgi:hypothetical protein
MQPKPAGEQHATAPGAPAERLAPVDPVESSPPAAPASRARPALVLRPQLPWRALGPGLILLAVALVAVGRLRAVPFAFVLVVVGAGLLPAWWDRLEVGETAIVRRAWRRHCTIAVADVDGMGLRRATLPALRFLPRGYKFGRYWTIPLTLRLLAGGDVLLELRCVWWSNWRELARYIVTTVPDLELDSRTRGRLERYVGVLLAAPSQR